jgi:hypothetical protein
MVLVSIFYNVSDYYFLFVILQFQKYKITVIVTCLYEFSVFVNIETKEKISVIHILRTVYV